MSIRLRLAVVFMTAAAIVFAVASLLFVTELSRSLLASIDAQLAAQVTGASRYVPAPGTRLPATGSPAPGEYVIQVINASGRVRGASPDAGTTPMLTPAELRQARNHQITFTTTSEDERERLMAGPLLARRARPGWVAVASVDLEAYDSTISNVTRSLVIAGVVLVVASGLGAYLLARAALSPVERLRREAAALSEHDRAPSLRVPSTGDEIAALATTMNDLLGRLRRALARQRALVADASHELRTPFAVLHGELELAGQPGRSRAELAEAVSHATEEAGRLARITDQLLFLARADEDLMAPQLERISVRNLLTRSADHATARAAAARIICEVDAPADLTANVDPDRIREAVDNLVDNALRFAPAGTAIELRARAVSSDLVIDVRDSGAGFPPDYLPHAFERFRRPDTARARADGGAGLGLAIVRAIAHAHGGRAIAANRPSGGAIITLEFPGAVGSDGLRE